MHMEYGCKFRIYPDEEQEQLIQQTFGCCRFLYNHFLDERIKAHKNKQPSPGRYDQMREIPQLKREFDWLKEVDSTALQAVADNADVAFQNFFRRKKEGKGNPGYPKFKKKRDKDRKLSYKSKRVGENIKVLPGAVQLPKIPGAVKCRVSRQIEGRILFATVSQVPSGKYYVSLCCRTADVKSKLLPKTGKVIGIDMGITSYAVSSDGVKYPNHKYLARAQKRLSLAQKRLSRKAKGSRNREKARIAVAVLHEKISNKRRDTIHKLTAISTPQRISLRKD